MRALTIAVMVALFAFASIASGYTFYNGVGNGDFMDVPPVFTGSMDPGGDITAGSWTITITDDGWPTDPVVRAQYIWDTFYAPNYTVGQPGFWKGYFDTDHGLSAMNALQIVDETGGGGVIGTMGGVCSVEVQVEDTNSNGILDEGEFESGSLTGLVIIIRDGSGIYDGQCGTGNYFGTYVKDGTYETWQFGMYLFLSDCTSPVEEASWGSIKALYQ